MIYPYQEKIGMLWLTDHIIPAQEHFTSTILAKKIITAINALPPAGEAPKRKVLLFTPEGERHELPLLLLHYLLRRNNNKVIYFGSNIALGDIRLYLENHTCTHIMFHFITNFTSIAPDAYVNELAAMCPHCEIVMSGTQTKTLTSAPANVRLLKSMSEAVAFATA